MGLGGMGVTTPYFCHDGVWDFSNIDEKIGGVGGGVVVANLQRSS